jgi:hypothetical protein
METRSEVILVVMLFSAAMTVFLLIFFAMHSCVKSYDDIGLYKRPKEWGLHEL